MSGSKLQALRNLLDQEVVLVFLEEKERNIDTFEDEDLHESLKDAGVVEPKEEETYLVTTEDCNELRKAPKYFQKSVDLIQEYLTEAYRESVHGFRELIEEKPFLFDEQTALESEEADDHFAKYLVKHKEHFKHNHEAYEAISKIELLKEQVTQISVNIETYLDDVVKHFKHTKHMDADTIYNSLEDFSYLLYDATSCLHNMSQSLDKIASEHEESSLLSNLQSISGETAKNWEMLISYIAGELGKIDRDHGTGKTGGQASR